MFKIGKTHLYIQSSATLHIGSAYRTLSALAVHVMTDKIPEYMLVAE